METRELLKEFRKSKHLNQTDFASALGVPQTTYSCYESGRNSIPDSFIKLVSVIYGVSEDWLRTGEGDQMQKLSIDERLAERFGTFLSVDDPERKRLAESIMNLIESIPSEFYPDIAQFCQSIVDRRKKS